MSYIAFASTLCLLIPVLGKCDKLTELRSKLEEYGLAAYVIPNSDYHGSEVSGERDKRRQWVSGFTGSSGDAVVGLRFAGLATDSRYLLQAKRELQADWQLIPKGHNISTWLVSQLKSGEKVGADPKTMPYRLWLDLHSHLNSSGMKLVETEENLVDVLWRDRPGYPEAPIFLHDLKYSGYLLHSTECEYNLQSQNHSVKLQKVLKKVDERQASALVLSGLDDIAWLLNLRGGDLSHTPVFGAFLVLTAATRGNWSATLYLRPGLGDSRLVQDHLLHAGLPFTIKGLDDFWTDWNETAKLCSRCYIPHNANYFIYSAVRDAERRLTERSPVVDLRAYKTAVEVAAMRTVHIHDAVALCQLFKTLEEKIEDHRWRETEVAQLAEDLRSEQPENRGLSFPDIVAAGPNAALPHYQPVAGRDSSVNASQLLLIDSGGQYLGGTTDVTRTLHFGKPRPLEIEVYSLLVAGVARLGAAVFPEGLEARGLEMLVRGPLYSAGLSYGHGTTHGVGVFLSVHEEFNGTYYENFIGSQEPGFYEENAFGIRLENLVVVQPAETKYKNKTEKRLMRFSPLTLVPYERKLIDPGLLDESQLAWLNSYHEEVLRTVGGEILSRGDHDLLRWLTAKTAPISKNNNKKTLTT